MRILTFSVAIMALVAGAVPTGAAQDNRAAPMERFAALKAASGPQVDRLRAAGRDLAAKGDGAGLAAHGRDVLKNRSLTPAARERLLREAALGLAELPESPAAAALLDELAGLSPEVWVWLEDAGHRAAVPLYDVGAAARYSKGRWMERRATGEATEALAAGNMDVLDRYARAGRDSSLRRGIEAAFASADPASLAGVRGTLKQRLEAGQPVGEIARIAAAALADPDLYSAVLLHADRAVALRALTRIDAELAGDTAVTLRRRATDRDEIASAALLGLARDADTRPDVRDYLFDQLGDDRVGASAAAALARVDDPGIVPRLSALVTDGDDVARRQALLALRLSTLPAARAELARVAADRTLPEAIRREAGPWR